MDEGIRDRRKASNTLIDIEAMFFVEPVYGKIRRLDIMGTQDATAGWLTQRNRGNRKAHANSEVGEHVTTLLGPCSGDRGGVHNVVQTAVDYQSC